MLATMRSGIADYTTDPALVARLIADPTAPHAADEVIAAGLSAPRTFAPGAEFAYSNTNYVILGQILEQVCGARFADLLAERVLAPLGLDATWWPGDSSRLPDPFARGYTLGFPGATPDHPVDTTDFNPSWASTAGALVSTAEDLLTFARALGTGALLTPESQGMRIASLADAPALGPGVEYGIGLMGISGWIGHSGHIPGYRTACYYHPQADAAVVVLTAGTSSPGIALRRRPVSASRRTHPVWHPRPACSMRSRARWDTRARHLPVRAERRATPRRRESPGAGPRSTWLRAPFQRLLRDRSLWPDRLRPWPVQRMRRGSLSSRLLCPPAH